VSRAERILAGIIVLVGLLVVGWLGLQWYGRAQHAAGYAAAVAERAARDALAIVRRTEENIVLSERQSAINLEITEAKYEELAPVVQRIYVDRVRVGAATCGPATTAETEDASSGHGADPAGRLVRDDVERDTRALEEAVERHLATARACQAWGAENGFTP